jgi:hypothetical protein
MPPTSIMCADITTHAINRSPTKIGRCTITSCGCRPPPLCGSLAMNTSCGAIESPWRSRVDRIAFDAAPKWKSICPAPTTTRPCASSSVHE